MSMIINGVPTDELNNVKEVLTETPSKGQVQFRVEDTWTAPSLHRTETRDVTGAMVNHSRKQPFVIVGDEPQALFGNDHGISPVELLLTAMTHCVGTTFAYHAALQSIELDSIKIEASGDISLAGFMGIDDKIPARLSQAQLDFHISSAADADTLLALIETAVLRSPVVNTVSQGTDVQTSLEHATGEH